MEKEYTVYGLVCPISSRVFYVGYSSQPKKRLTAHLSDPASSAWVHCQTLRRKGLKPSMIVFAVLTDRYVARMVEARLIRCLYQEITNSDTNLVLGLWHDLRFNLYE